MSRVVVTGASGNVGSALLRRLVASGEHDVVGLDASAPAGAPFDAVEWWSRPHRPTATGTLREVFTGADAVVHLAWGFQPSHDLAFLEELGVGGTRRVLDAVAGRTCRTSCTCRRWAPTPPSRTTSRSTRAGRPVAFLPRRTAGTRRPRSGCSTPTSRRTPDGW